MSNSRRPLYVHIFHINKRRDKNTATVVSKEVRWRASYLVALLQYLMMRVRKQQAARTFPWQHSQPKRCKNTDYKTNTQKTAQQQLNQVTVQLMLLPAQRENQPREKHDGKVGMNVSTVVTVGALIWKLTVTCTLCVNNLSQMNVVWY